MLPIVDGWFGVECSAKKIAVVGGGAAGFFAAIQAAQTNPSAFICILESSRKPLAKVLVSGGGRCNVTNHTLDVRDLITHYPRGSKELQGAFSRFAVQDTIDWFHERGVVLKTEHDQRMFPVTDRSETIAECLARSARDSGVIVELEKSVNVIEKIDDQFQIRCKGAPPRRFDTVIFTTGGKKSSFKLAEGLGHTIVPPVPSLFTFQISDPLLRDLAGISFPETTLCLSVGDKTFVRYGPLLITHWGLSGPAIIQLSALAARELHHSGYSAKLRVSFLAGLNHAAVMEKLITAKERHGKGLIRSFSGVEIPKRFWERVVELSGIRPQLRFADCSKSQLRLLAELLTGKEFQVRGKGVFKEEFVTCGGVLLKEVDFRTMQSKLVPNLYFAGEVLDIDGITGGFNFQSAWTTGWIAGNGV